VAAQFAFMTFAFMNARGWTSAAIPRQTGFDIENLRVRRIMLPA
jgi:hypothetical protein